MKHLFESFKSKVVTIPSVVITIEPSLFLFGGKTASLLVHSTFILET